MSPSRIGGPYDFGSTVILNNIHYFEYNFGFLRLGICGEVIITRPQNAFQISDFFPVFSWHNANIKPNNLSLIFDVSAVPFQGFEVYGQYGFDDINASIAGGEDSPIPTIDAGLLGASWWSPRNRFLGTVTAEIGFTHYLWGSFLVDVPLARAIYRMDRDGPDSWMPLTSPFGPGCAWALLTAKLDTPWNVSAAASFQLLSRNSAASLTGPYKEDDAIAGATREVTFKGSLEIVYQPWPWLRLSCKPALQVANGQIWGELTLGARSTVGISSALDHSQRE